MSEDSTSVLWLNSLDLIVCILSVTIGTSSSDILECTFERTFSYRRILSRLMISVPLFVKKDVKFIRSFIVFWSVLFIHKKSKQGLLMPDTTEYKESLLFDHQQSHLVIWNFLSFISFKDEVIDPPKFKQDPNYLLLIYFDVN